MVSLAERVAAEARRKREPLQIRRNLLEGAARLAWLPGWIAGRAFRVVATVAVFAWRAARLGFQDGFGVKETR